MTELCGDYIRINGRCSDGIRHRTPQTFLNLPCLLSKVPGKEKTGPHAGLNRNPRQAWFLNLTLTSDDNHIMFFGDTFQNLCGGTLHTPVPMHLMGDESKFHLFNDLVCQHL